LVFYVFLEGNFIDLCKKCGPNLSKAMSAFRYIFDLVPQEVSLKVSWFTLTPFWLNFESILVASGALLVPFRINLVSKPPLSAPESAEHLQITVDTLAEIISLGTVISDIYIYICIYIHIYICIFVKITDQHRGFLRNVCTLVKITDPHHGFFTNLTKAMKRLCRMELFTTAT
jgi:hypothetical protein